ncbi:hypothetical protein BCR37DRAFT_350399 [Protomyces lactucae-debilis]|uniref:SNF5-domain-containing protein n=1 Tax=Protomyces lactucae-debilis TaxID=2754530 RepID=A0A1Y2F4D9_PROLT|nr:uncharacterized protein BCR37DRAFT_350399 [Protomyces lactucae-debilis]ORY78547.1 hypothetical protein BCR37DRAFT_350399 [Protomyces lactucae-debilis]
MASWIRVRSDYIAQQAAAVEENLIPIRLDLELGNDYRLKDVFLWNLNEELITPTEFAVNLVTDLQLSQGYVNEIAREIRKQLEEYAPVANLAVPGQEAPVIVELEVHLSRHLITDKFEWDLQSTAAVEAFTRQTCQDLGLFGEFNVAMSCAIREQLMKLKKELVESPPGRTAEGHVEIENECAFDRPMGLRVSPDTLGLDWVPKIEILSREEIEKRDGERDRVVRRLRRETAKFGRSTGHIPATTMQLTATGRKRARTQFDDLTEAMPEHERGRWRCAWCRVSGQDTWEIGGAKKEYCRFCMPSAVPAATNGTSNETISMTAPQQVPGIADGKGWRRGLYSSRNPLNTPVVQASYIGAR